MVVPIDDARPPLTLNVDEVARELRVSRRTVYELLGGKRPALPSIKVRGRRLVTRAALDTYLDTLGEAS